MLSEVSHVTKITKIKTPQPYTVVFTEVISGKMRWSADLREYNMMGQDPTQRNVPVWYQLLLFLFSSELSVNREGFADAPY